MKKLAVFFCIAVGNIVPAFADDGIHFDVNEEFVAAFENCTPYDPEVPQKEKLARNKIMEEYDSIKILGMQNNLCVFDLIMQMSSRRMYGMMVKRCSITAAQKTPILNAIKNIKTDDGHLYSHEIAEIMDQCAVVHEE